MGQQHISRFIGKYCKPTEIRDDFISRLTRDKLVRDN